MRQERTEFETLSDNALLLTIWAKAQGKDGQYLGTRLKLTKLAFLVGYSLFRDHIKALNTNFYRWTHGPMSNHLYGAWEALKSSGYITEDEVYTVTPEGMKFARDYYKEVLGLPSNRQIKDVVHSVASTYGAMDINEILSTIYDMDCFAVGAEAPVKIRRAPMSTTYTLALDDDEASSILEISPGWQVTLELAFNKEASEALGDGISDAISGNYVSAEQMWNRA